jgi:predicted AAA+ superfamily ATPase
MSLIPRLLATELTAQLREYPVVTVLGPRQSGKTTLVRATLPDYAYVSLEDPENRQLAHDDPKAFLSRYAEPTIYDEIQRTPHLLSYLQGQVDAARRNGRFVLTGSHQLALRAAISQSLAGRTGVLHLLPFSVEELQGVGVRFARPAEWLLQGFLPRIYDQQQRPRTAYANYYQTYVERDVRQLVQLRNVGLFEKFLKLLAGRVGQLMNMQSLAGDVGVDGKTVGEWLAILEASFVIFKLPPYFENFGKRAIKAPKYYFVEPGLLAYLLDIETPAQIERDPLLGAMFENLVVVEALKARFNRGMTANLHFFRDSHGHEIDLLFKRGAQLCGIEIKAASTWHPSFRRSLDRFAAHLHPLSRKAVIYNGTPFDASDGLAALGLEAVAGWVAA